MPFPSSDYDVKTATAQMNSMSLESSIVNDAEQAQKYLKDLRQLCLSTTKLANEVVDNVAQGMIENVPFLMKKIQGLSRIEKTNLLRAFVRGLKHTKQSSRTFCVKAIVVFNSNIFEINSNKLIQHLFRGLEFGSLFVKLASIEALGHLAALMNKVNGKTLIRKFIKLLDSNNSSLQLATALSIINIALVDNRNTPTS